LPFLVEAQEVALRLVGVVHGEVVAVVVQDHGEAVAVHHHQVEMFKLK
jgi:hypothetical protein